MGQEATALTLLQVRPCFDIWGTTHDFILTVPWNHHISE